MTEFANEPLQTRLCNLGEL